MVPYTRKSCMVQPAQLGTNVLTARRRDHRLAGVMRGVMFHIRTSPERDKQSHLGRGRYWHGGGTAVQSG